MAFGSNKFNNLSQNFSNGISKGFASPADKSDIDYESFDNPYKFTPNDDSLRSRIRFYDRDSLWARWRRGYELYALTQTAFSTFGSKRDKYGDFRMYCAYQLYPGIFIPVTIYSFPTNNQEIHQQLVGVRDANGFNFYDYGLSILGVRYLSNTSAGTYSQSGTTITVTLNNHGYFVNDSVYLKFTSGTASTSTLTITSTTQNTFTCTASGSLTTSGSVDVALSTTFGDNRWTQTRVKLRSIFNPIPSLIGERLVDRAIERDPGITSTYSRAGSTVTVTCSSAHGLSTGNSIFVSVSSGNVTSKQYVVTVLSSTQLQFTTIDSGATSGSLTVTRLIGGYDYGNYVGYTLIGVDTYSTELIFQRADSYGAKTVNNSAVTTVPAERGFIVGRFLTTEIRYHCTCQDYTRRAVYNFHKDTQDFRFPTTPITSTKPGFRQNKDNSVSSVRDNPGTYGDLGYIPTTGGFYKLPDYKDTASTSNPELYYYQIRWCKHIYAALFSINHDEGNEPVSLKGTYSQTGPNITVFVTNHNLLANTKVQVNFTSGSAIPGEYTVTQVLSANSFNIVYPFSGSANGYCSVSNIRRHTFVDSWLYEPSDKPVGDDLDVFYKNLDKENGKLRKEAERMASAKHGIEWTGENTVTGNRSQPQQIADYRPKEISMYVTDNIRRVDNEFDVDGGLLNESQRMSSMMSKLFNIPPAQIINENMGMLNQPLYNYVANYQYGYTNGGQYINGKPYSVISSSTTTSGSVTEDPNTVTVLDCLTYDPVVGQELVVDAGFYIN